MKLRIEGLCFRYRRQQILHDVHLEIPSGSLCALMGANGAGKTTLLKSINGILQPQAGRVMADETDVLALKPKQRARFIGYVPQNAQAGESNLNVMETVLSGRVPHMQGRLRAEDREIAEQALEEMALAPYALRPLNQLSGGERQRVFIARAIAQQPKILLLDEPTNNLDMRFQQDLMERMRRMSRRQGITIVTILHDLNLAIAYADQAVLLKDGGVYAAGAPRALLNRRSVLDIFQVELDFAPLNGVEYAVPCLKEDIYA